MQASLTYSQILGKTFARALCPAYCLEEAAFNPDHQLSQYKGLHARVTAIAAPFLYSFQTVVHGGIAIAELPTTMLGITQGIILTTGLTSSYNSACYALSSLAEMPQKLWQGHQNPPNYFGNDNRYAFSSWKFDLI